MNATADRGFTWSDEETSTLLELWGAHDAQSELTGNKRNFPVYEKISESMIAMGYVRSASQCREKIKRMKREYALTKQHLDKKSGPKKNMRFFEQFHKILLLKQMRSRGAGAAKRPSPKTADSSEAEAVLQKGAWDNERSDADSQSQSQSQRQGNSSEKEEDNAWAPDVLLVEGENNTSSLFDNPASPSMPSVDSGDIPPELPYLKSMMDSLVAKLMKYQTESDSRILTKIEELENERTAADERMHKMWMDFEEKWRKEEREHELNVMKVFQDIMNQMKENTVENS